MKTDTPAAPGTGRLPISATPEHYAITLSPDLDAARFDGDVAIEVIVHEPTSTLVCNAAELEIESASVELPDGRRLDAEFLSDETEETLTLVVPEPLPRGAAQVRISFAGVLNDKLRGFYRSTYTGADGVDATIACTQFEATDARRAFPCWDEPAHKATFDVTLVVDDGLVAISNGPETARTPTEDGRIAVQFATTMKMSTYLVAFVVGPLELSRTVDVDGVPLRIVCRPGQTHLAELALDVGAFALRYFADYYGIAYPGEKMDMVAVPDFAFGAMENLGCVIYRENLLLVDPTAATQAELQAVVDVIAHELAHMWFGDLVTMAWWEGIWLNEAFATFMEMRCTDAFRPEWNRWLHFGRERTAAFGVDALASTRPIEYPVHSPADAEGMFDVLTYQKGSAVVRMLEQYLGEDRFRSGIHRYLTTHQFGNTQTGDLWDALEDETGEPVRALADSWIFQGGFPVIDATRRGERLTLHQSRFRLLEDGDDDPTWHVPVLVRSDAGDHRIVLDDATAAVDVATDGAVVVNAGGHAFYRTRYDAGLRSALTASFASLAPLERYAFVDDQVGLFEQPHATDLLYPTDLATLVAESGERALSVWQRVLDGIDLFARSLDDPAPLSAVVIDVLGPVVGELGWEPRADDDELRRALRGALAGTLGIHGDPDALDRLRAVLDAAWRDPASVDADLAAGALRAVVTHADGDTFDAVLDRFRHGSTPQEQFRHLYAAAEVRDPELFRRYLDLAASDEIRSQNLAFAYRGALRNRANEAVAWIEVRTRWDAILDRLPFNSAGRAVEGVAAIGDPSVAADVEAFLAEHPVPQAATTIAQSLERMRASVARRQAHRPLA